MFDELEKSSVSEREEQVLHFWEQEGIFEKSIEQREEAPFFSFFDGPPFATGLPHYGHLLAGTIKDVVPRYKTMKGFRVPRRFGWDCHGLPIENEIEKAKGLSGAAAIEEYGIANFNEECRKIVLRYTKEWKGTVQRMGRWVDFGHTYRTMDTTFMESVWWVFKQLYDKGLIYEGFKVMPFSAKLGTPLSNFEATQNYKEVDDPALTVSFVLEDDPETAILAWTTTPWTLISNLALTVHSEIEYVKVKDAESGMHYILAADRVATYFKDADSYSIVATMKGADLVGTRYLPLFDYFSAQAQEGAFRVISADFVTTEEGTGIVHTAAAFGEDDFYACQEAGIAMVRPVDRNGQFTKEVPEYEGMFVKDADKDIIKRLKTAGRVVHHGTCRHRYPFCWRSDTPLIYRAMRTWFVSVEKIKDRLLAANEQVHWTPGHIKEGRFGKWLSGARDWAISRNRYWGCPIPLWRSEEGDIHVVGSVEELETLTGQKLDDIHRHFIDDLSFTLDGKEYHRIPEVFDCWFESGSMPYAQNHYPFENVDTFERGFPGDFIAEGLDQTRGWFYTLMVLSVALFDKPAFKNVIVNGILLAEDGNKMSKSLKNYPDPMEVVHKYGADAVRLYMLHSPAVRGDDLSFSERGVELVLRQVLIPLWNAYSFFITYARLYGWKPDDALIAGEVEASDNILDRWMISQVHKLIRDVEEGMDAYDLSQAVEPLIGMVDQLTNWYIRRSRRRFWQDEDTPDRRQAFATLYTVLLDLSKVCAPFVPFVSEEIYRNLRGGNQPLSVHLCNYPAYDASARDERLEAEMAAVQRAVSMGHALRKEHMLKVRQPLAKAHLVSGNPATLGFLDEQRTIIAEELNVKEVVLSGDEHEFVHLKAKPNFRVLGKKVGKLMRAAQQVIDRFGDAELETLRAGGELSVDIEGEQVTLTGDDVEIERVVQEGMVAANEGDITIVLDTSLSDELRLEGLAREVVNKINTMRRDAGYEVADRIRVQLDTTDRVRDCFAKWDRYICGEVLAVDVAFGPCEGTEWDLNGEETTIALEKVEAP